ncbi:LysR family transcriptional regulator [Erwinia sp. HR93]|uniref:LysR family transcriptional regulator n=1 Tax=Erwinia sp. HR93 TaxID=3094840 RepID=UPI002ADEA8D4|nr:LysR family transcriptional regulator [Erwinia sp. HR93]MEA1063964.1 LysR family transcriptional regulator [Erwinia sp. HR93]
MHLSGENIQLFLAVLEHGSFSAAARALRRVPSAVSMAIANMEAELGFALFDRSRREPVPTARALALAPHARLVADRLNALQVHALELSQGLESKLSIALVSDINSEALLDAARQISLRWPQLEIEIIRVPQDDALHLLLEGRVSLCLAWGGLQVDSHTQFQWVAEDSLIAVLAAHHPALSLTQSPRYLEDLINVRQIAVASRERPLADVRPQVAQDCWYTNSFSMALEMVSAGLGWGNFPSSVVTPLLEEKSLVRLTFRNTENALRLPVHLIWRKHQPLQKAAQSLVTLMSPTASATDEMVSQ